MTTNTSKEWLRPEEYVDHAPELAGTVNIHHCKQGPGNDRLYITRKEDGTIVAYCHHCGSRGAHSVAGQRALSRREQNRLLEESRTELGDGAVSDLSDSGGSGTGGRSEDSSWISTYPARLSGCCPAGAFKDWGIDAKRCWLEYGLTVDDALHHNVHFDPHDNCIIMPGISPHSGEAIVQRKLFGRKNSPKYITEGAGVFPIIERHGNIYQQFSEWALVIVEDLRSAYKLSKVINVLPLLGTELKKDHVSAILNHNPEIKRISVWLDNDSHVVINKAVDIKNRLSLHNDCDILDTSLIDPKEYNMYYICEILSSHHSKQTTVEMDAGN